MSNVEFSFLDFVNFEFIGVIYLMFNELGVGIVYFFFLREIMN